MVSSDSLCMSCMRDIGSEKKCPHCGYYQNSVQPAPYLPVRTCIGNRYLVGKIIEYNGEGATYIGWDMKNKVAVNIREFLPERFAARNGNDLGLQVMMGSEATFLDLKKKFEEIWIRLAKLNGLSSIVKVTGVLEEFGTAYAVYEHFDGISLRDFLLRSKNGYMTWDKAKQLIMPVLSTLSALHQNGIIHRGISPTTLVIGEDGKIKITGFSIGELRTSGSSISPQIFDGYAPVEQYGNEFRQGTWTDVYAIAAVLYFMLIGSDPMNSSERLTNDRLMIPGKFMEMLPRDVINAIVNALQLLPNERTKTIEQIKAELSAAPVPQPQNNYAAYPQQPVPMLPTEPVYDNKPEEKKESSSASIVIKTVLIVIAVCVLIGGGIWAVITLTGSNKDKEDTETKASATTSSEKVEVPNFKGKSWGSLQSQFPDFTLEKREVPAANKSEVGYVVDQSVSSGTKINKGSVITIDVGAEIIFPDVRGKSAEEAKKILTEKGFENIEVVTEDVSDMGFGENNVQYVNKSEGAKCFKEDKIVLSVYVPEEEKEEEEETTTLGAETSIDVKPSEPPTEAPSSAPEESSSAPAQND